MSGETVVSCRANRTCRASLMCRVERVKTYRAESNVSSRAKLNLNLILQITFTS
jgi:hypothetical protein